MFSSVLVVNILLTGFLLWCHFSSESDTVYRIADMSRCVFDSDYS